MGMWVNLEKIFGVFYEDWTHADPTGNLLLHSNTVLVTLNNIYSRILSVGYEFDSSSAIEFWVQGL